MASGTSRRTNEERSATTRAALVAAARQLFENQGFEATGTEAVVASAGVTRGALYHHFTDKRDLLRAVVLQIQEEIATRVINAALAESDPWELFVSGWMAFLDDETESPSVRLLMVDAPAALGMTEWTAIDDLYCLQPAIAGLEYLMQEQVIEPQPVEELARVLLTASNALATLIASSEDPAATRATVVPTWRRMLAAACGRSESVSATKRS
jgi:AcrR family transcriptional regulator